MKLHLEWLPPIILADGSKQNLIYTCDIEAIPERPGIYIFGRRHGSAFEALYVGKTSSSLQVRVKQQFNNVRLMQHIRNAKNGERLLLLGRFMPQPGQQADNCVGIIEQAFIRHYLEGDDDLVNVQGARLKTHEVVSEGAGVKHAIPMKLVVDR